MSWLTKVMRPKIKALISKKKEIPENLWSKCPKCEHMIFHRDLAANHYVCTHCQYHMRLNAKERLNLLFDNQQYYELELADPKQDPLNFKDSKKYSDRLKSYRQKTGQKDAVIVACGTIGGQSVVVYLLDFNFMGGSMGMAAGNGLLRAADKAIETKSSLIVVTGSGGARMQEGILSLMQMPRTTIAVSKLKEAGLAYLTLLTDPTTGGVTASFAMLGDIAISEPGAMIGFSGKRVIEDTIRQKLPDDFQTAEYLLAHGMIDMVVHRHQLRETFIKILSIIMDRKVCNT